MTAQVWALKEARVCEGALVRGWKLEDVGQYVCLDVMGGKELSENVGFLKNQVWGWINYSGSEILLESPMVGFWRSHPQVCVDSLWGGPYPTTPLEATHSPTWRPLSCVPVVMHWVRHPMLSRHMDSQSFLFSLQVKKQKSESFFYKGLGSFYFQLCGCIW